MGNGDFGSNGSVHWNVRNTGSGQPVSSVDPVDFADIGSENGHKGFFRVTLKFEDDTTARAALNNAQFTGNGTVRIKIPKIEPQRQRPGTPEVTVTW